MSFIGFTTATSLTRMKLKALKWYTRSNLPFIRMKVTKSASSSISDWCRVLITSACCLCAFFTSSLNSRNPTFSLDLIRIDTKLCRRLDFLDIFLKSVSASVFQWFYTLLTARWDVMPRYLEIGQFVNFTVCTYFIKCMQRTYLGPCLFQNTVNIRLG